MADLLTEGSRIAEIAAIAQVVGSVGMFGVIWVMQVVHNHFDPATLDRLIGTNWIRTAAWTVRAAVAIAVLVAVR